MGVEEFFQVSDLDADRLLIDWRWLCPSKLSLVARNVFGELFLTDDARTVFWLNVTTGTLSKAADSVSAFRELAATAEKQREWFTEEEMRAYAKRGLIPDSLHCIGFAVPAVFAEGGTPATAYLADLYEYVSFLGDLHRQISSQSDGTQVKLRVHPPKPMSG